jgi:hypothetical protein
MTNRTETQLNRYIEKIAKAWNLTINELDDLKELLEQREIKNKVDE